ncbi:Ribonuclease H domain [Sesbania bispinosa]|nr:Ribonuclease H domain [Sesbania bispinosa]
MGIVFYTYILFKWEKPCVDQIALNTDGSVNGANAGFGGLLRHHDGSWISGYYGHLKPVDILEAELVAILKGLRICWHYAFRNVLSMMDSSLAVHLIHNKVVNFHRYATLLREIQALLDKDWSVSLKHSLREGNQCADYLAKQGAVSSLPLCHVADPLLVSSAC